MVTTLLSDLVHNPRRLMTWDALAATYLHAVKWVRCAVGCQCLHRICQKTFWHWGLHLATLTGGSQCQNVFQ